MAKSIQSDSTQTITNIIETRDATVSSHGTSEARVVVEKNTSTADPRLAQSESTQNTSVTNTQCIIRAQQLTGEPHMHH